MFDQAKRNVFKSNSAGLRSAAGRFPLGKAESLENTKSAERRLPFSNGASESP